MPRKPGGSVVPHSEVRKRFRRCDIADQVLAALKYRSKSLEELALFLGIDRGQRNVWYGRRQELERCVDRLIDQRHLPIEKHVGQGRQAQDRTVKYSRANPQPVRAPKATPAATNNGCKVWIDPGIAGTWSGKTRADISAAKKQNWNQVAAASEAQSQVTRKQFREQLNRKPRQRSNTARQEAS